MKQRVMNVCQCLDCGAVLRSRFLSKKFSHCIFCKSSNLSDKEIKNVFVGLTEKEKSEGLPL